MSDLKLIEIIRAASSDIDWPDDPHLANRVASQLSAAPRRGLWRWLVPVAALVIIVALLPPARDAVGDVLTRAGVMIGFDSPADIELKELDLGEAVELVGIESDFDLWTPQSMDDPDGVFFDGVSVHMVWMDSEGVETLLSQRGGETVYATKTLGSETEVLSVDVGDASGLWIEGADHVFSLLDPAGAVRTETSRLAQNVLLWSVGGVDYRLELRGGQDEALKIATSLVPAR